MNRLHSTVDRRKSANRPDVATEHVGSCPVCASENVKFWCESFDRLHQVSEQRFRYVRCGACGTLFQSERPVQREMALFYPDSYGPYSGQDVAGPGRLLPWRVQRWLNAMSGWLLGSESLSRKIDRFYGDLKPGACFLDFGCGSGVFLDRMQERGCKTIGMDMSATALDKVRSNGHVALFADRAAWDGLETLSIDFIRMSHVVEHLYEPFDVLNLAFDKLSKGGKLHVIMPNSCGWSARLFRSFWFGLECPRHLILPPPELVAQRLTDLGFQKIAILHQAAPKDALRSIGYLLDELRLLGRSTSRGLINNSVLNLLLSFPSGLFTALGWSDRYHILARRIDEA